MPSEQNTDREALGDIIDDWLTDPDHIDTGFLADAILSSQWLAEHDERVRREAAAEQRGKDAQIAESRAVGWNHDYDNGTFDVAAAIREQGNDARS